MVVLAKEIEATYEVLAKMGEGGMGAVYKVRHRFFDEIRVVKVMQAALEPSKELQERFLGEAKRGKLLKHPNMAEVLDFSVAADGTSYIVMEYIEGVNLRDVLARNGGPLDHRFVVSVAEQALDALSFLHSRKFVHRDISPDNLMLVSDGSAEPRVKLIDLGIAKSLESTQNLTMAGKFIGKVQYASPEQFGGEVDGRSDLYSLGLVLYELLTGAKPITGKDYVSIIAGHVSRPPRAFTETDPSGRVPAPIRAAVLKALAKHPEERFQTAADFAEALRSAVPLSQRRTLPEPPVVTRPADLPPPERTVPVARTMPVAMADRTVAETVAATRETPRPRRWYAIAAVALVLAGAGAAFVWKQQETNSPAPSPAPVTVSNTVAASTVTVQAAAVEDGQLLINALPWGMVTSVVNATGVEQLSGETATPFVLSLPPGSYQVRLSNPNSGRDVVVPATVTANTLSRVQAEVDRIDAAAYVDGAGIGQ